MSLFRFKSKGKLRQLVDLVYPVGSIYISTASTNPGTLFGGTWEAFAPGRVLIGAGQGDDGTTSMSFTALGEYGEYKHSLTVSEMPNHAHNIPALNYEVQGAGGSTIASHKTTEPEEMQPTSYEGKNKSFSLIQPSIAVNIWKRTA